MQERWTVKILLQTILWISIFVNAQGCDRSSSLEIGHFQKAWNSFLESKNVDQTQIGEEGHRRIEFSLIDEWGLQQLPRQRESIPGIDDREIKWVPYVENRITLLDGTEMSASYIHFNWTDEDDYHDFIATQAPLEGNVDLFWKMIWENKIEQIVMVTEIMDDGVKQLCYPYLPVSPGEILQFNHGLQVQCIDEKWLLAELKENIHIRTFKVSYEGQERVITHYWYRNWIDKTAPQATTSMIALIKEVYGDKKAVHKKAPIVVHCAAGVGRTGVFIAGYHLSEVIQKSAALPRLFDLVGQLRWQRPKMVSKPEQYEFCYRLYSDLQSQ